MSDEKSTTIIDEVIIKGRVRKGDVELRSEVRKLIPEGTSQSVIDRMIPSEKEVIHVSTTREWWISQGYRPCKREDCTEALPKSALKNKLYCSDRCR